MGENSPPGRRAAPLEGLRNIVRRHPVITSVMVGCTLIGAALGLALLTDEWSAARRLLAGAVAGAGTGLLITATKIFD